jgi:ATP:ADP antiporter, AAA family
MQNFFQRIFRLQPGEGALIFVLGYLLFGNALARQVSSIVAISGFLNTGGVNQMLLVLGIDYTLVLVVGGFQSLVVDRINRIRLMALISAGFAFAFMLLRVLFAIGAPGWLNYSVMYLISEQQFVLFPIVFWILANDIYSFSQAKRLFPLIASWSFIGKLLGIGTAAATPALFARWGFKNEEILLLNVLIYVIAFTLIIIFLRKVSLRQTVQQSETVKETLSEGWDFVRGVDSFRYLILAILTLAIADTIIEFRFWVVTDAIFIGQGVYQNFYSLYRLGISLVSFGVQTFLTSRLLNTIQLKNVFLIFPIVILLGVGGAIASPAVYAIVLGMATVKLVRETMDESARKNFQSLVPEERRGRVSIFMDNYLPAVGTILACLVTGLIVVVGLQINHDLHLVYLSIALVCGATALWATLKMRKAYESSLLNWRLKRRQRTTDSVLDKLSDL